MWRPLFLKMLNREAASPRSRPTAILERLPIREGSVIADIGSGGGFFTLAFARQAGPSGRVYAVDNQPGNLAFIRGLSQREGLDSIVCVPASQTAQYLPQEGVDLVFVRNVFHHLTEPEASFRDFRQFLKPGGKVALIEHRPTGGLSFVAMFKHATSQEVILQTMNGAGYRLRQSFTCLPHQTFDLFEKPETQSP